jgi:RNA polymerase sigma-70 factor, ECF subfamily
MTHAAHLYQRHREAPVDDSETRREAVPPRIPRTVDAAGQDAASESANRERLVRLAYRFLWDVHDAEDVVHDALAVAVAKRPQLEDQGKWSSWLYRIVIQRCLLHRRKGATQRRHMERLGRVRPTCDTAAGPASGIETCELVALLRTLIDELPDRQRTAIILRHLESMDYQRIAHVMEVSESTVRVHVRAARESLRRMVLERHPEWTGPNDA